MQNSSSINLGGPIKSYQSAASMTHDGGGYSFFIVRLFQSRSDACTFAPDQSIPLPPLQLQGLPLSRLEEANGSEIPKGRRGEKRSGRKFVVGKGGKKGREGGRKEEIKKKRKGKREGKEGGAH